MRYAVLALVLFLAGCAGESSGPVQPAALTPEEEKAILERVDKVNQTEAPQPSAAPY
jgi:hypothetical protein